FSLDDLAAVLNDYFAEFRVRVEPAQLVAVLERSRLVVQRGRDASFRYSYIYYFFVASYLMDVIAAGDAQCIADRDHIADRIHSDEYSSILVFYLYLKR